MMHIVRLAGSPKLTVPLLLVLGAIVAAGEPALGKGAGSWGVAAALFLITVNLAAALAAHPRLRRGGLGVFHTGLLALLVLVAVGRLTHYSGRLEIAEGTAFAAHRIEELSRGPWHRERFDEVGFVQGPIQVDYLPRLRRDRTVSRVHVMADGLPREAGDDTPLVLGGYRLYTTHNKGFAVVLAWTSSRGTTERGVVHLPSYPLYDWKQTNSWTAQPGLELELTLLPAVAARPDSAWRFAPAEVPARLRLTGGGASIELDAGEEARLPGGTIRFEGVRGWMGYTVFYDPTLHALLAVAVVATLGLGWHLLRRRAGHALRSPAAGTIEPARG